MDVILNRNSLELKEKITFAGNGAIAVAWGDEMPVILTSKSGFIVSRIVFQRELRLEKEMGRTDVVLIRSHWCFRSFLTSSL